MRVVHFVCRICKTDFGTTKSAERKAKRCEASGRPSFKFKIGARIDQCFIGGSRGEIVIVKRSIRAQWRGSPSSRQHTPFYYVTAGLPKKLYRWSEQATKREFELWKKLNAEKERGQES